MNHQNVRASLHCPQPVQLRLRGNNLAAQGHLAEALEAYREALQHAPSALAYKIHSNMSLLALTSGDVASAVSAAATALEQAPRDFTTVRHQVLCLCARGASLAVQQSQDSTGAPHVQGQGMCKQPSSIACCSRVGRSHGTSSMQAKIRMIEACLAAQDSDAATEYLRLAVRDDASFQKTVIFRELDKKVQAAATG